MMAVAGDVERILPKIAVYSCYFGYHEPFNPKTTGDGVGYDRIIFTDHDSLPIDGVRVTQIKGHGLEPKFLSRRPKLKPNLYLPEYDWTIYLDNSANLRVSPLKIVEDIENSFQSSAPKTRYMFRHYKRDCVYHETKFCTRRNHLTRAQYSELISIFQAANLPRHAGLYMNTMLIQKMGGAQSVFYDDLWYDLFLRFSHRDQITGSWLKWAMDYQAVVLDEPIENFIRWPLFRRPVREAFQALHQKQT